MVLFLFTLTPRNPNKDRYSIHNYKISLSIIVDSTFVQAQSVVANGASHRSDFDEASSICKRPGCRRRQCWQTSWCNVRSRISSIRLSAASCSLLQQVTRRPEQAVQLFARGALRTQLLFAQSGLRQRRGPRPTTCLSSVTLIPDAVRATCSARICNQKLMSFFTRVQPTEKKTLHVSPSKYTTRQ